MTSSMSRELFAAPSEARCAVATPAVRGRASVKHFSSAKMPAAGEESVLAALRLFGTPHHAAAFLCADNERMHAGSSSKQNVFCRDFLGES